MNVEKIGRKKKIENNLADNLAELQKKYYFIYYQYRFYSLHSPWTDWNDEYIISIIHPVLEFKELVDKYNLADKPLNKTGLRYEYRMLFWAEISKEVVDKVGDTFS